MTVVDRRAGRVLLLDAEGRVLLFRGGDPSDPTRGTWWFTPGGGLDAGESPAEGASRELFEETGLRCLPEDLGECVHAEESEFDFAGRHYVQWQQFFLLRVDGHDVDTRGFEQLEADSIVEHRWWDRAALRTTGDAVFPLCLVQLLDRLGV
ncbi:MAG: NUDIX domain-containing protein [Actinomycetota bacterium]|nr:NUDIX domain-containing protein [Actinomycetota bacterium]